MVEKNGAWLTSITSDFLAVLMGQPPVGTASQLVGEVYGAWLSKKSQEAHDILLSELKSGNRIDGDFDVDAFFGLLFRYLNAVKQGAAKRNLRLLAQLLARGIHKDFRLESDKLAANALLLQDLRHDELQFIGAFWKEHLALGGSADTPELLHREINKKAVNILVPEVFESMAKFTAIGVALQRTGLFYAPATWDGPLFCISPKLIELMTLCDIESVL
jgi:hypothetical protein